VNIGSSARKPSLRERQRDEVTRALVDAAESVIAERGLAGAAIAEVARRAGVAVGTVYNHFADRDALVRALFADRRARIAPALRAAADVRAESFEPELRAFVTRVLTTLDEHATFVRIAFEVGQGAGRDVTGRSPTVVNELRAATDKVLARAGRSLSPRHAALHAPLLIGAMKAVVVESLATGGTFAQHADAIVDLFLDGARRR
jgi:AcrR family transcriptional regulator